MFPETQVVGRDANHVSLQKPLLFACPQDAQDRAQSADFPTAQCSLGGIRPTWADRSGPWPANNNAVRGRMAVGGQRGTLELGTAISATSNIRFKCHHMVLATVHGDFRKRATSEISGGCDSRLVGLTAISGSWNGVRRCHSHCPDSLKFPRAAQSEVMCALSASPVAKAL